MVEKNWAGNVVFDAARWHRPETVEEVCGIVRGATRVRAVGTRHSFSSVADAGGWPGVAGELLSLERMTGMAVDRKAMTVTVEAGVRYGELGRWLAKEGLALANMASLPHINVAGAVATATHGSGVKNGNLATAVAGMEVVGPKGSHGTFSREKHSICDAMIVGLGAFGIVTKLMLKVVPAFEVGQEVFEGLAWGDMEKHIDVIMSAAYSVSLFTDWKTDAINQVWVKRAGEEIKRCGASEFYGAKAAAADVHPIAGISAENCTPQMGVAGPWHERLPHFRLEYTPSSGEELQSEYFVPREKAVEALRAVRGRGGLREKIVPLLWITEIRTVAADDLWMSMAYERDSVAIHFTWKPEWERVRDVLPEIEAALEPFGARPHWGKLFTMGAKQLERVYPRMGDFRELVRTMDPGGKFRNAFVDEYIFGLSS